MNTLGAIKVLLVSLAFEHRVGRSVLGRLNGWVHDRIIGMTLEMK